MSTVPIRAINSRQSNRDLAYPVQFSQWLAKADQERDANSRDSQPTVALPESKADVTPQK